MSGQRIGLNSISSPKKCSDYPISGKIWPRNALGGWLPQVVTAPSSSLLGNIALVVLGLPKNSLIVTLINRLLAEWLPLGQLAGSLSHLRMLEEPTTLTRHGQSSCVGTTHRRPRLCAESHSKRDQLTCSRVPSHCA